MYNKSSNQFFFLFGLPSFIKYVYIFQLQRCLQTISCTSRRKSHVHINCFTTSSEFDGPILCFVRFLDTIRRDLKSIFIYDAIIKKIYATIICRQTSLNLVAQQKSFTFWLYVRQHIPSSEASLPCAQQLDGRQDHNKTYIEKTLLPYFNYTTFRSLN